MTDLKNDIIEALNPEIKRLKDKIENKKKEIEDLDDWEMDEREYDEFLDGCYPSVDVCGSDYSASFILKEVDEVRYEMGKSEEEDEQRRNKKVELEDELQELEDELDDLMNED